VGDSDDLTGGGADADPGSAGDQSTGWDTAEVTTEGGSTSADEPLVDLSGGGGGSGSSEIEIAFCFNDNSASTHTVYAKSREDAEAKSPRWNYCHLGACQSDDALKEQCE
jgi:hypothetical protein